MESLAPITPSDSLKVQDVNPAEEAEILAFLGRRPIHTVIMAGMIRDNGLISPINRGRFFTCRDHSGELQGVALIGHVTMVETCDDEVVGVFARFAQRYLPGNVIVGESAKVGRFWRVWSSSGTPKRLVCRELLFERAGAVDVTEPVSLTRATLKDLSRIVPIHAQMAFEESAINPLERDPVGFRDRVARRIQRGRVWTYSENGQLICKADVISHTPEQIYLEGVYVNPKFRHHGFGARFLSELSRNLLTTSKSICVLVNEKNRAAQDVYRRIGYEFRCYYDTIYLEQSKSEAPRHLIQQVQLSPVNQPTF